jgi:pseudoazurin
MEFMVRVKRRFTVLRENEKRSVPSGRDRAGINQEKQVLEKMKMRTVKAVVALTLGFGLGANAMAEEHVIKGVITNWVPLVTYAKPGDTIKFMQMAGHDTETVEGMLPEGATPWKAKMGEEGFSITVEKEGAYIFKCNPHITTGMVGAIVVGDKAPANLAQLETSLENVKLGKNMVARTIKKMKQEIEQKGMKP